MVTSSPQINLYLTDFVSNNQADIIFQHDCLHIAALIKTETDPHQIISYCLTEWPTKWNIQKNNFNQKFTFAQLYQQNITSQQLYFWSAPIDIIEHYQLYLNQLLSSNNLSSMALQLFYNCTLPRFGSFCQYSLDIYRTNYISLNEIIYEYYQHEYYPNNLTCYIHLECNRGLKSMCLDWSEICDGFIDCQDGNDEEFCWQLKLNDCGENKYQCLNGQCISKVFFRDDSKTFECLDRSDEIVKSIAHFDSLFYDIYGEPTFKNEDILCLGRHNFHQIKMTGSCLQRRTGILKELLWSAKPDLLSDSCWLAVTCVLNNQQNWNPKCQELCSNKTCKEIINETCPNMMNIPASTLAFGHIFFVYTKDDIIIRNFWMSSPEYVCYNDQLCDGFYSNKSLISFNNATCRHPEDFPLTFNLWNIRKSWDDIYLEPIYRKLSKCNKINYNDSGICNNLTMYKCLNSSKCISKYRLCDIVSDCDYNDDEECSQINGSCPMNELVNLLKCTTIDKCISLALIDDEWCDCGYNEYGLCDDEYPKMHSIKKHISFSTICDGFTELIPITIDGRNETDETECEYWSCNNTYTRCDGFWNCLNGADEVDCNLSSLFQCPSYHHI